MQARKDGAESQDGRTEIIAMGIRRSYVVNAQACKDRVKLAENDHASLRHRNSEIKCLTSEKPKYIMDTT